MLKTYVKGIPKPLCFSIFFWLYSCLKKIAYLVKHQRKDKKIYSFLINIALNTW